MMHVAVFFFCFCVFSLFPKVAAVVFGSGLLARALFMHDVGRVASEKQRENQENNEGRKNKRFHTLASEWCVFFRVLCVPASLVTSGTLLVYMPTHNRCMHATIQARAPFFFSEPPPYLRNSGKMAFRACYF